ncbi:hypothetical protein LCGC14_2045380 [marine sediment metagenome]|uniref:Uncharacterized protein n=1 Tax=marine sediment metagenome TaxID=412755 RepID=A0A0F9EQS2_9ZZZZ
MARVKIVFIKIYRAWLSWYLAGGYGYYLGISDVIRVKGKIKKLDSIIYNYNKNKEN